LLTEQRLADIKTLETLLGNEGEFRKITSRLSRIVNSQAVAGDPAEANPKGRSFWPDA